MWNDFVEGTAMPNLRRFARASLALAFALSFASAGRAGAQTAARRDTLRVLFIGNSYTYFNNLGDIVAGIAASRKDGPVVLPTLAVRGGALLRWHLTAGPAMAALDGGHWDYVVLQEQSQLGGGMADGKPVLAKPDSFFAASRDLAKRIRAHGAQPLFYMTWAKRDAPDQSVGLAAAYDEIGRELNSPVAPAGLAWATTRSRMEKLELYIADGSHPTPTGSYLNGLVIYATMTAHDPRGAAAVIEGHPYTMAGVADPNSVVKLVELDKPTASALQEIAWSTVKPRLKRSY